MHSWIKVKHPWLLLPCWNDGNTHSNDLVYEKNVAFLLHTFPPLILFKHLPVVVRKEWEDCAYKLVSAIATAKACEWKHTPTSNTERYWLSILSGFEGTKTLIKPLKDICSSSPRTHSRSILGWSQPITIVLLLTCKSKPVTILQTTSMFHCFCTFACVVFSQTWEAFPLLSVC